MGEDKSAGKVPDWYRKRGYIHFDLPVGPRKARKIVESPARVAAHAFYPLISYDVVAEKISRDAASGALVKKEKSRPISYASHVDSHIYSYYARLLSEPYEKFLRQHGLEFNVLAFRSLNRSNVHFAKIAFDDIRRRGSCSAVALDVTQFFTTLDHQILKAHWSRLLDLDRLPGDHFNVYKSITRFAEVDKSAVLAALGVSRHNPKNGRRRLCEPEDFRAIVRGHESGSLIRRNDERKGIPQGTPISAVLSNIYMMDVDVAVKALVEGVGGTYLRYCDDMLVIVPTEKRGTVAGEIRKLIKDAELDLNTDKTVLVDFGLGASGRLEADKPLQYLGFTFDGQRVLIRSAAFAKYSQKMKRAVSLGKQTQRRWNRIREKNGRRPKELYRRKLYSRYSHLGKRNFLSYGFRAASIMDAPEIRGQLKPLWGRLLQEIEK